MNVRLSSVCGNSAHPLLPPSPTRATLDVQKEDDEEGTEHSKVSKVNLVDLAGSERSDAAGTSGIRLRVSSLSLLICMACPKCTNVHKISFPATGGQRHQQVASYPRENHFAPRGQGLQEAKRKRLPGYGLLVFQPCK
jgi:hypothetical protein